jgi:small subunit ribosomal protein S17
MSDTTARNRRKVLIGEVISITGNKSLKVASFYKIQHPLYKKEVKRKTIFHVHDEDCTCNVGDRIEVMETRPISKSKRWRVIRIVEKARESDI